MAIRQILLVLLIISLGTVPGALAAASDKAQIQALENKFAAAFEAKNVDAIMRAYVPDETLVVFDVVPPRQYIGAKAYRKDWETIFGGMKGPVKFSVTDLDITTSGTLGYSHSIQHLVATGIKGEPIDLTVRVTDVYRKIKGNWLIVHEHVSIPVDLDTGRPDFASRP